MFISLSLLLAFVGLQGYLDSNKKLVVLRVVEQTDFPSSVTMADFLRSTYTTVYPKGELVFVVLNAQSTVKEVMQTASKHERYTEYPEVFIHAVTHVCSRPVGLNRLIDTASNNCHGFY